MDRLIDALISGDLNTSSLLLLFIIGILTKRFVPWWVHEEALAKLEQYEQSAPELLDEIGTLIGLLQEPQVAEILHQHDYELDDKRVRAKSEELRKVVRKHQRKPSRIERGRR